MAGMEEGAAVEEFNTLVDRTGYLGSRIRMSLVFLCEKSTNLKEILVHLLSHGLLSQRESEIVENERSSFDGFFKLFTFITPRLGHGDNAQHFVNAFQKSGNEHILEELKSSTVTTEFVPRCADTSLQSIRFNVQEPVPSFCGREKFLLDLDQHILQSHRTAANVPATSTIISRICVVTGLGGIGKTETVRKYIHSYGHFYQHVVWIDAEEYRAAENQFRKLALHELHLSSTDLGNKAKDFDVILKEIYNSLCISSTLLVLDNAEALHDSDSQRHGVARFLPKSLPPTYLKPVIIITSRQIEWRTLHKRPIPLLTPQESSAFILSQLNLNENEANAKDAKTLSETFGGLPLALQATVAVILQESKRNKLMGKDVCTIQHLLSDYNQEKRKVLEKRPPGSPDTQPLMLLWKVSLDKIRQQPHGHLTTQILDVMAHLSSTNIPKGLLFFIFNSEDIDSLVDAVTLLVDYSFVSASSTHFSVHRVLQDVTLAHLDASTEEHPQEGELLLSAPPLIRITTELMEYWPTFPKSSKAYDAVHDNLVHVTMSHVLPKAENPSETDLHFIEFIVFVLKEIKDTRWVEAEKCCRVLIAYFTSLSTCYALPIKSLSFRNVVGLRLQLAEILKTMGRYKEAGDICQASLSSLNSLDDQTESMLEMVLGTKNSMASIIEKQGEYEEAIKLNSRVLDLYSKLHGPTHPSTLASKNNLALTMKKSGRLNEAKTLYAEVFEVITKDRGPLHLVTLTTKHNMATILTAEGRYDDALEMHREVAEVQERELGPLHAETLISSGCMADLLGDLGKHEDSLRIYADVISRYEKASAASHPDCLTAKSNMALILEKQGNTGEAKEILCHVLEARERLLGPSHEHTLITKYNVACVLEKHGKDAEALKLYEEVLELETKHLGPTHPATLQTNHNIVWLYLKMGDFEKAESIAKEVLAARQTTLSSDHPVRLDCKNTESLSGEKEKVRLINEP